MLLLIHQESASQASIPSQEGEMGVYYKSVIIQDAPGFVLFQLIPGTTSVSQTKPLQGMHLLSLKNSLRVW